MSLFRYLMVSLFSLTWFLAASVAGEITIPDPTLEAVLREALAKPSGALTEEDLASLSYLDASGDSLDDSERIVNLTGLSYAVNLEELRLDYHAISDLGPLWSLKKLQVLSLIYNRIGSVAPLASLPQIEFLDLRNNQIVEISALWGLRDLGHLDLSFNFIDLDHSTTSYAIDHFDEYIVNLNVSNQRSKAYSITSDTTEFPSSEGASGAISVESNTFWSVATSVDWITIDPVESSEFGNGVVSFTLTALPDGVTHRLGKISLEGAWIEISQGTPVLVEFQDSVLEEAIRDVLNLPEGGLTQTHLAALTGLSIFGNEDTPPESRLSSLLGLEHATNLESIDINYSLVSDLDPIRGLSSLRSIRFSHADLSDVGDLTTLENLTYMALDANSLVAVPKLPSSLQIISLNENQISDISELESLSSLESLSLNNNEVADISVLQALDSLRELQLNGNLVQQTTALSSLSELQRLGLEENHIDSVVGLGLLTKLHELRISRNYIDFSKAEEREILDTLEIQGVTFLNGTVQNSNVTNIGPVFERIGQAGGALTINVSANSYWSASSEVDWITFLDGDDRFGSGTLSIVVKPAPGIETRRTATIRVGDNTTAVTQYLDVLGLNTVVEMTIRSVIGKPVGALLDVDLEELTSLHIDASGDANDGLAPLSLDGLAIAKNLTTLGIIDAKIDSLQPLFGHSSLQTITILRSDLSDSITFLGLDSLKVVNIEQGSLVKIPEFPSTIETLSLMYNRVSDLSPLKGLVSLQTLKLHGNAIQELDPLLSLTQLVELDLGFNAIRDAGNLASLEKLEILNLYGNHLNSLEPFFSFPTLQSLNVVYNYIDFSYASEASLDLSKLQLEGVEIESYNQRQPIWNVTNSQIQIGDSGGNRKSEVTSDTYWSAVSDADWVVVLDGLDRKGNGVLEFQVLANPSLKDVRTATIQIENQVIEISQHPTVEISDPLVRQAVLQELGKQIGDVYKSEMSQLESLSIYLEGGALELEKVIDLSGLETASNLENLWVSAPVIENWSVIFEMDRLKSLQLSSPHLDHSQLDSLEELDGLESLILSQCALEEIPRLPGTLKLLSLNNNSVVDLTPLKELSQLRELYLLENLVSDLSPLAGLAELQVLLLDGNEIDDIEALRDLSNLNRLSLYSNRVRGVSALKSLKKLRELNLAENHIKDVDGIGGLDSLLYLYLSGNYIDLFPSSNNALVLERLIGDGVNVYTDYQNDPNPVLWQNSLSLGEWESEYSVFVDTLSYWLARTDQSWIHFDDTEHFGRGDLVFSVAENKSGEARTAVIEIENSRLTVEQAGGDTRFVLSTEQVQLDYRKQWFNLEIQSDKRWSASASADWVTLSDSEGTGDYSLQISVDVNSTNTERTAIVSLGPKTITISQSRDSKYFEFLETLGLDGALEENWLDLDADGDGWSNALEFTRGSDLFDARSIPNVEVAMNEEQRLIFELSRGRSDWTLLFECSEDLETWKSVEPFSVETLDGGLIRITVEPPEELDGGVSFYRFNYILGTVEDQ